MAKESFMLVSLKEDKAKKLAQVMSNPTCTRILDYLAGKDATESQISKELKIPLSTVHYNLQQLVEAKLVVIDEFHYSEKGREVNHYKLANKYIIIAPQEDDSFLQHIRKYIPVTIITLGLAAVLKTTQWITGTETAQIAAYGGDVMPEAAPFALVSPDASAKIAESGPADAAIQEAAPEAVPTIASAVQEEIIQDAGAEASLRMATPEAVPVEAFSIQTPWWQSPMIDYFIAGAIFVLLVIIIVEAINHWRGK